MATELASAVAHNSGLHEQTPGAQVASTTAVDAHRGDLRFGRRMLEHGRLQRIVGLSGPFPPG
jgi:hypothetical protein